ncbi:MAG TPA: hypothetical protein PKC30_08040 [Saprospiraceae bacterium]|nr:hypothetical protein [Saprospiraceae bacterium]
MKHSFAFIKLIEPMRKIFQFHSLQLSFILIFITIHISFLHAQEDWYDLIKDTEMSIPSSPAFAIMGVNPEMVLRPSDIRSFKVDWRIKNYNLAPDLAIEGQPLWHLLYKKRSWQELGNLSDWEKRLSSLSISLGNAKVDGINHAAWSVKLNLYKSEDHLFNKELLSEMQSEHNQLFLEMNMELDTLRIQRNRADNDQEKTVLDHQIERKQYEIKSLNHVLKERYRMRMEEYELRHWNRTMVDGAFGMVYTYDNAAIDSLKVRNAGYAMWINGAFQTGQHSMVTTMLRYTGINDRSNIAFGGSFRYGGPKFNFYLEAVYERLGNYFDSSLDNPFTEKEVFAGKFEQDIGNGWLHYNSTGSITQYTIAYGGDFRLTRNILLNFALRSQFSNDFSLTRFIPVANIICLMK